ncbi:MAG: hypothetical protein ACLFSQ_10550 [Candidatus Zixiibacteriota bacterium]
MAGVHAGIYSGSFFLGASGFTNFIKVDFGESDAHHLDDMTYGGFNIRFIPGSSSLFRFSSGLIVGGGTFSFDESKFTRPEAIDDDLFFAIEPDISIMLNLSLFIRLGYGLSYRGMLSPDFELYKDPEISGFTTSLFIQFGNL